MNREDAKENAQVMLDYANGSDIEYTPLHEGDWSAYSDKTCPTFDWYRYEYRVKHRSGELWAAIGPSGRILDTYEEGAVSHSKGRLLPSIQYTKICWREKVGA